MKKEIFTKAKILKLLKLLSDELEKQELINSPELRFLNFCQIDIQPKQLHFQIIKRADPGQFSLADEFTIPTP